MSAKKKAKYLDKSKGESSKSVQKLDKEQSAPWKLQPIFSYNGNGEKHSYLCNLCANPNTLNVTLQSRFNLRRHLERSHNSKEILNDYEELVKTGRIRRDNNHNTMMDNFLNQKPTQAKVDSAVVNLIISANLPFTFVREKSFKEFVNLLQPGMKVLAYKSLIKKMSSQVIEMKENMMKTFEKVKVFTMTADGWTCARRSFIGVTVHWLDGMERKSAVLACKRILGSHTHENIAKHLEEIIISYGLFDKLGGGCVTDNAANFVASFEAFGVSFKDSLDEPVEPTSDIEVEKSDISTTTLKLKFIDDGQCDIEDLDDIMEQHEVFGQDEIEDIPIEVFDLETTLEKHSYTLPMHFRCAVHCMNLVAKTDVDKFLPGFDKNGIYKKVSRRAMSKMCAVWNLQNRSTSASDIIREKCGKFFITPVATRWNSLQNSVKRFHEILVASDDKLRSLFTALKIVHLTDVSI